MMDRIPSSDELGTKIIKVLGLPEHVTRFELIFEANKPILIKCDYLKWNIGDTVEQIASEFAEYELHKLESHD